MNTNKSVIHEPWIRPEYSTQGIDHQKIAIVGYSHWWPGLDRGELDVPTFTVGTIKEVINPLLGEKKHNFFSCIRNRFGFSSHEEFWKRVLFFNYLPRCIGGPAARYAVGTPEDHAEGSARLRRILAEHRPDKLIVFSGKAWEAMPAVDRPLDGFSRDGIERVSHPVPGGIYQAGDHSVLAFGLCHTQGAPKDPMTVAVQRIMDWKI